MSIETARQMHRTFLDVLGVEVEICTDESLSKHYIRHHLYWKIVYNKRNPDPVKECIVTNLELMINQRLSTVRWVGYRFEFETVAFTDENMTIEAVMLPLAMFEEFMRYHYQERAAKGAMPIDDCSKLGGWLVDRSLLSLLTAPTAESSCRNPLNWFKQAGA